MVLPIGSLVVPTGEGRPDAPSPQSRLHAGGRGGAQHEAGAPHRAHLDYGFTEEDLRNGWDVYGDEIMDGKQGRGRGTRPWGWWQFVAGEEQPRSR